MKRLVAPLALGMAALYLALAVGTAGCLFLHPEPSSPVHHHNTSHVTHSALCAWACQANQTVSVLSLAPSAAVLALLWLLPLRFSLLNPRLSSIVSPSRAPPSVSAL